MENNKLKSDQINELARFLQKKFKLMDWDITVILDPSMAEEGVCSTIEGDYKAVIYIKSISDIREMKRTLIHEFLHIIKRDEYYITNNNLPENLRKTWGSFHERNIEKVCNIIHSLLVDLEVVGR